MAKVVRTLVTTAALIGLGLVAGFYIFAMSVGSLIRHAPPKADGIVVLTGGEDRVATGIELISKGYGRRLLISGVHPKIGSPDDIRRRLGGNLSVFNCCVDLGHEAHDTIGNAAEARDWADALGYRSLIVVTSSYHMPRSLAEFSRSMPNYELIPYPVPPRSLKISSWWQHQPTARLLVGEYFKFLTSAARLGVSRIIGGLDRRPAVANRPWPARVPI